MSDLETKEHPSKPASVAWDDFLSTLYVGEQINKDQVINLIDSLLESGSRYDALVAAHILMEYSNHCRSDGEYVYRGQGLLDKDPRTVATEPSSIQIIGVTFHHSHLSSPPNRFTNHDAFTELTQPFLTSGTAKAIKRAILFSDREVEIKYRTTTGKVPRELWNPKGPGFQVPDLTYRKDYRMFPFLIQEAYPITWDPKTKTGLMKARRVYLDPSISIIDEDE